MTLRRALVSLVFAVAAWAAIGAFVLLLAGCHRLLHLVGGP